jgi:NH3-dependent NAD+ synthetase
MTDNISKLLELIRKERSFNPQEYINSKTDAINNFFTQEKLNSIVIGISGGIDSAVTLRLFEKAASAKNSPIINVTGLIMPIFCGGTSNQQDATERGLKL